jgi:acyl carrier protein
MQDAAERLETIFSDLMEQEVVPVVRRTKLNCASWDSMLHLHLIIAIEQEFGIRLTDEEVTDLNSFESALQVIQDHLGAVRNG